jgi:hypothetical protein
MLPPGASFITPSVPEVQDMLARAHVSMDIVALAVCILDSMNSKFSRSWRVSFPLATQKLPAHKRHTLPSGPIGPQHIDSVSPEVLILTALVIATKFVEDMQEPTQYFASEWGRSQWTCEQINYTERCMMECLEYRILPLWNIKYIKQARHDIEMARRELLANAPQGGHGQTTNAAKHLKSMSHGQAMVGLQYPYTPADTPKSDTGSPVNLDQHAREAFGSPKPLPPNFLSLPAELSSR